VGQALEALEVTEISTDQASITLEELKHTLKRTIDLKRH
jgi:hypothetical protein